MRLPVTTVQARTRGRKPVASHSGSHQAEPIATASAEPPRRKPVLRWAGSKMLLLPEILKWVPKDLPHYVEPFAGSASLFTSIAAKRCTLGDINSALINFYRHLKKTPQSLYGDMLSIPNSKREYYRLRKSFSIYDTGMRAAVVFFYLNRNCFNGVFRTSQSGHFNVPRGKKTGGYPSLDQINDFSGLLSRSRLVCGDFSRTLAYATSESLVYLDPPYNTFGVRNRGEYGPISFSDQDVSRLSVEIERIKSSKIILSYNYDKQLAINLEKKGWEVRKILVKRHVAGFSSQRRNKYELLARNFHD
jgi:DNA adenine methylase